MIFVIIVHKSVGIFLIHRSVPLASKADEKGLILMRFNFLNTFHLVFQNQTSAIIHFVCNCLDMDLCEYFFFFLMTESVNKTPETHMPNYGRFV